MVAQEVQNIIPEAVKGDQSNGLSINYNYFIGLLIAQVKELSVEMKKLKDDINKKST